MSSSFLDIIDKKLSLIISDIRWALLVEHQSAARAGFTSIDITSATFNAPTWKHLWRSEVSGNNNCHNVLCLCCVAKQQACPDRMYRNLAQPCKKYARA